MFAIQKQKNTQKGFTLVEMLIAVLIFTLSLAGLMTISSKSLKTSRNAEKQVIADYLAIEAIEVVHNLRDAALLRSFGSTTWELVFQGSDDIVGGNQGCYGGQNTCNFYFENIQSQPVLDTCDTCDVYVDNNLFYYFQTYHDEGSSHGKLSGFSRKIRILPGYDDGQAIVIVDVSWKTGSVRYVENLYLWQ